MSRWREVIRLRPDQRRIVARAATTNVLLNVVLRFRGAKRAYRCAAWLGRHGGARQITPTDAREQLAVARDVAGLVNHVATVFPARSACLVRSLTLQSMLQRRGIDAQVVVGARREGAQLLAHAWVEVGGEPVNDRPAELAEYAVFNIDRRHWAA